MVNQEFGRAKRKRKGFGSYDGGIEIRSEETDVNISSSMSSSFQTQRPSGSPPPKPTGEGLTERLDADKNGSLSAAEIEESRLGEMIGDRFGEVDTDGDGALSTAELDAELKANAPTEG